MDRSGSGHAVSHSCGRAPRVLPGQSVWACRTHTLRTAETRREPVMTRTFVIVASMLAASLGQSISEARNAAAGAAMDSRTASALAEFREAAKLTPDRMHGAELFATCAACHGPNGRGT